MFFDLTETATLKYQNKTNKQHFVEVFLLAYLVESEGDFLFQ